MLKLSAFLLAFSAVCFATPLTTKCKLPPPQEIDWSKMKGTWPQILHDGTVIDVKYPCSSLNTFIKIENGFSALLNFWNKEGQPKKISLSAAKTADGYYIETYLPDDVSGDAIKDMIRSGIATSQNNKGSISKKVSYYTDYINFFMVLECDMKGKMDIWVHSSNAAPTAGDVLRVTNKLIEFGNRWNEMKLSLSECVTTPDFTRNFASGQVKQCELPPPQDIDWSKMQGNWIEILNVDTDLDKKYPCYSMGKMNTSKDGFSGYFFSMGSSLGKNKMIKFHAFKTDDGYHRLLYLTDDFSAPDLQKDLVKYRLASSRKSGGDLSNKVAYYTDYKNYLIGLECDTQGNKSSCTLALNASPDAGDVLRVVNKFSEFDNGWSNIQLSLSGCVVKE